MTQEKNQKEAIMKTKARLIVTHLCPRSCSYCCNKSKKTMDSAIEIKNLADLKDFKEIMITGGEPLLYQKIDVLMEELAKNNPEVKLYLYTAFYKDVLNTCMKNDNLVGIQYTVHEKATAADIGRFKAMQGTILLSEVFSKRALRSKRLVVHDSVSIALPILPSAWNKIRVKSEWKPSDIDCRPKEEELFIFKGEL